MSSPSHRFVAPKTEKGRQRLEQFFLEAVNEARTTDVIAALKNGVDPNLVGEDGLSAIHIVAETGLLPVLDALLAAPRININLMNHMDMTPLMIACMNSKREVVQALLRKGADPNFPNSNGNRALHYACRNSDIKIVFDLMNNGAKVNEIRNIFDVTPLTIAAIDRPSIVITRYLLRKGAHLKGSKEFPLLLECALACNSFDRLDTFTMLVRYGMEINQLHPVEKRNSFHYVAITGYLPLAEFLLAEGADHEAVDATNRKPIEIARNHGHWRLVRFLTRCNRKKVLFADQEEIIEGVK